MYVCIQLFPMQSLVLCWLTSSTRAQYASYTYSGPLFYGYNPQQQQQQQQLEPTLYPDAPVTYNRQYPATGQSAWSGAPIVVTDEANSLEQQQQQQQRGEGGGGGVGYLPFNYNGESRLPTDWNNYRYNNNNNNNNVATTRAANHNYNNVPGYVYSGQQQQPQQSQLDQLGQRELLDVADTRRNEEQIVRIGGSRSGQNYYEPAQLLQRRQFEAKYQNLFAEYLRKYPQRLQPISNTAPRFVDK